MKYFQIFKNIQKHISLDDEEIQILTSLLVVKKIAKRDFVLRQGTTCKKLFFVEDGSLRAYHINDDGKESTIMFAVQDWWITDMDSFVNQTPSLLSIEALEHSKIIELSFQSVEELYRKVPKFERFFRILFQNAYVREQQRALQNIGFRSEERYRQFTLKYPAIVEKVTQKQIASYLGITPEFLSSIKKK